MPNEINTKMGSFKRSTSGTLKKDIDFLKATTVSWSPFSNTKKKILMIYPSDALQSDTKQHTNNTVF